MSSNSPGHSLFLRSVTCLIVLIKLSGEVQADPGDEAKLRFLDGKWPEALALQEKVVAAARAQPNTSAAGLIEPLDFLAQLQEFLEDFPAARRSREELVKLAKVVYAQ